MILFLTHTMYGNVRCDDNIIYMIKVITIGLYISRLLFNLVANKGLHHMAVKIING
jgi:hypothetical protein